MNRTVLRMLDEAADRWPNRPYTLKKTDAGYKAYSFSETRAAAHRFAAWLIMNGFRAGDSLAILAEGSPEWIIAECGMLCARCVSVPLSVKLLAEEIPFRLNHAGARAVVTSRNQWTKVLAALRDVENRELLLFYVDEDIESARASAVAAGVDAARVVGFSEALAQGLAALSDRASATSLALAESLRSVDEDDVITICYTSGTTGNPKGIMLSHLNYWTNCHDGARLFDLPMNLRMLVILPVDHSFAHTAGLYSALLICGALYFVDSRGGGLATLRNIPTNLLEAEPTVLMTVPALSGNFMKRIIAGVEEKGGLIARLFKRGIEAGVAWNGDGYNRPPLSLRLRVALPYALARLLVFPSVRRRVFGPRMQYCVGGGALLELRQQEFFAALGVPIFQGYGLTEAAPVISSNTPDKHKFGSSGIIAPSVECRLLRADGTEAAVGENAEIVIRGLNVMKGYYRNPEATASALRDGWLYTGDIGHWDADGFLVVVGREKALLIAADGEKYSPETIEEAIFSSTEIVDQVMAWCEQQKYVTVLVTLDQAAVKRLIKKQSIVDARTLLQLISRELFAFRQNPKIQPIQPAWVPRVCQILPCTFSEENGTLNSTMKLVRRRVVDLHRDRID
ncbi:MAG TPA: AMP-binding protein, partial [Rectinemataceae bacterium]|nr:AMP-binding protein [Rectinemataceae bacterium]